MIAILKYNAGNATSVQNALNRLGFKSMITDEPEALLVADQVIFPGVGAAGSAMSFLKSKGLDQVILSLKQPVLGICLGMQIMCRFSEENHTPGLGIFDCKVSLFPPHDIVPHTGWNNSLNEKGTLFDGLGTHNDFYFVHSYYAGICASTIALTQYILPFSAALQHNNFFGVQFHPEKSGDAGMQLLKNFITL